MLQAGVATAPVTPPLGIAMGGYAHRDHGAESVADDLHVKVLAFEHAGRRAAVVTADVVNVQRATADAVKASLTARFGLDASMVLLTCSHTHSGPYLKTDEPGAPRLHVAYFQRLCDALVETTGRALAALRPVSLTVGVGRGSLGINRRRLVDGVAEMLPNPAGPRDDDVLVVDVRDARGAPYAVLFQYACHPTCLNGYHISADWPGAAMRRVEAEYGATCVFVQGCCGDVRPNFTSETGRFRGATVEETHRAGAGIGQEVLRVLTASGRTPVQPRLDGQILDVGLVYASVPSATEIESAMSGVARPRREWAEFLARRPYYLAAAVPFRLQRVSIGDNLVLVGLEGEICVGYGLWMKTLLPGVHVMPVGYANGDLAYIPTADMFPEGGYEVERSCPAFGLASPFSPAIDPCIREALRRLLLGA